MKIIQAMKKLKDLNSKSEDLRAKVKAHAADLNVETPLYTDQKRQVSGWIQSHSDILKEILNLRVSIQRTNLATKVTIELAGAQVNKSIAEWIHRRRDLAKLDQAMWASLTDRGLKEQDFQTAGSAKVQDLSFKVLRLNTIKVESWKFLRLCFKAKQNPEKQFGFFVVLRVCQAS